MNDTLAGLYEVILERKNSGAEGSYTAYLFEQGLDKILKKIGEESSEVIIASKNLEKTSKDDKKYDEYRDDLKNEVCDLMYHLLVMMAEQDVSVSEIDAILEERRQKTGNLKQQKIIDKNT